MKNRNGKYLLDSKPLDRKLYLHWRSSCAGKVRYKSYEEANQIKNISIYKCQYCNFFHISQPNKPKKDKWIKSTSKFSYVTFEGKEIIQKEAQLVMRTFTFFLKDETRWNPEKFLVYVWKHAGFLCEKVVLSSKFYRKPENNYLSHGYDLYFRVGRGFLKSGKEANDLMMKIELDLRKFLGDEIEIKDSHLPLTKVDSPDIL